MWSECGRVEEKEQGVVSGSRLEKLPRREQRRLKLKTLMRGSMSLGRKAL